MINYMPLILLQMTRKEIMYFSYEYQRTKQFHFMFIIVYSVSV